MCQHTHARTHTHSPGPHTCVCVCVRVCVCACVCAQPPRARVGCYLQLSPPRPPPPYGLFVSRPPHEHVRTHSGSGRKKGGQKSPSGPLLSPPPHSPPPSAKSGTALWSGSTGPCPTRSFCLYFCRYSIWSSWETREADLHPLPNARVREGVPF